MIKGVFLSLLASCLFGSLYYFPVMLQPLSAQETFSWRLIMSAPAMALLITAEHKWFLLQALWQRIKRQPALLAGLLLSAAMLALQMFIFIWAPLHNRALSTSLGYFILPLVMVLAGRVFYKESLSVLQTIAVVLAAAGVIAEIYFSRAFSWETALVALGYPIYLIFRRKIHTDNVVGLFLDFSLIALGGAAYLLMHPGSWQIITTHPVFWVLIPALGIVTALAFAAYFAASRLLPLGFFGLLNYIEPVLFVVVSMVLLHEGIPAGREYSYYLIWAAVLVLAIEGVLSTLRYFYRRT